MYYKKPALTFQQQIGQLKDRGLVIEDEERANRWLLRVSYYRFSAYFLPFKVAGQNHFSEGTTLSSICNLYNFDRKLRLLFLDAIERIEVAVRTAVTYHIGRSLGPFGHTQRANFSGRFDHARFMAELYEAEAKSRETFVSHYRTKYTAEKHLPIWMASELLSLGAISRLYGALRPDAKRSIADPYGLPDPIFASWIHTLSVVRNICAHHSRLWNRELGVAPKIPPAPTKYWPHKNLDSSRIYTTLLIAHHLLMTIAPKSLWGRRLIALLDDYGEVNQKSMGFPADWLEHQPWAGQINPVPPVPPQEPNDL